MSNETVNKTGLVNLPDIPDSVDNALKNLSDEPTKNMGATLGDLWFLVFGGISHAADKRKLKYAHELETYKMELEESIEKIPAEKRIEPSVQVTAQALENSKYCVESKDLRDMFTNLISNSMNIDYQQYVHPSFAEMIKQMSPIDGQILKIFKHGSSNGLPICDFRLSREKGYLTIIEKVFLDGPTQNVEICSTSLSSLEHLGLITIPFSTYLVDDELYKKFESHPLFIFYKEHYKEHGEVYIEKGKAALTPLGRSFVNLCISD